MCSLYMRGEDNLLVQVLRELTRKDALVDSLFVNREALTGEAGLDGPYGSLPI